MISDHKINPVGKDLSKVLGKGEQEEPTEYCVDCGNYYHPEDMIRDKCRVCDWKDRLKKRK